MPKKPMRFRHLERENAGGLPAIIDAHQIKPIVDNMGLAGKSTEERIVELVMFTAQPKGAHSPKGVDEAHYTAAYPMLPIETGEGFCRQRVAMLSAMLESQGIGHEIKPGEMSAWYPILHIGLGKERLEVHYIHDGQGMAARLVSAREGERGEHKWLIRQDGSIEKEVMPYMDKDSDRELLESYRNRKSFADGVNRVLLERLIRGMKK